MFGAGKWSEMWGLSRPAFAILGMIAVLMLLSAVTIWRTAAEANRIDSERTALALRNAVASEASELQAIASDNGQWDDAAAAVYDNGDVAEFFTTNYLDTSADGRLYDGVVALRADGSVLRSLRRGRFVDTPTSQWVGQGIDRVIIAAKSDGEASALVAGDDGPRLVGVAQVVPTSATRIAAFRAAAPEPVYILFTRPLDQSAVAGIGRALVLDHVRLVPLAIAEDAGRRTGVQDADFVTLRDSNDAAVAAIAWRPSRPGNRAIARSTPFIGLALLAGLLASILLLRRGYASISEMNRIALVDSLSQLPNRRALRRLTRNALRDYDEVALAFIDLDGFKAVNDLYGHGVGDELIVQCAAIIADLAPAPGGAARLGGDEFALLAFGNGADQRLVDAADQLLGRLRDPFEIGDRTIMVGASIGLSNRVTAGDSNSELMREADVAMYVAKRAGKMRRVWFEPAHDRDRTAVLEVERRLRTALDTDEFDLVYQPMIEAESGAVSGFEALLRWNVGDAEQIGPDRFIPIAEDTGLIDRIGEFVLRRACSDALGWGERSLSINVSAGQLRNPYFAVRLSEILTETGFAPERLLLEITEAYVVSDPVPARRVIEAVRALGVRVVLDDFGTGYASIGFLRQFAFDALKIDRSLVADALSDHAARTMLHSTIALARALHISTIAEGIETEAQALIMRAAGCDLLQGWHFAREGDACASAAMLEAGTLAQSRSA